jgi:hypothetical protein
VEEEDVLIWNHWIQRHSNRGFASTHEKITGARPGPKVTQKVNIDIGSPRLLVRSGSRSNKVAYWAGGYRSDTVPATTVAPIHPDRPWNHLPTRIVATF